MLFLLLTLSTAPPDVIARTKPAVALLEIDTGKATAVAISPRRLVTCAHALSRARSIKARFPRGETYPCEVLATDHTRDLALLGLPEDVPHLDCCPRPVRPGEHVLTLGHPYNLPWSAGRGVIAATGRCVALADKRVLSNLIQLDASINPGHSGGPVLNARGELVGILTATKGAGIGFAVPAGDVCKFLKEAKEKP